MSKYKNYEEYIHQAEEFAQPILTQLRVYVKEACPEVEEEFKWSFPNFTYNGSILCNMAGFKNHVTFGFWLGSIMEDPNEIMIRTGNSGMGHFGKITSLENLPSKEVLIKYIRHAMQLTDDGHKLLNAGNKKAEVQEAPKILIDALNLNDIAYDTFNNFSQSHRNEYIEWINEAKTENTKLKRLAQTIEWLEEGKPRNWKYMKKW